MLAQPAIARHKTPPADAGGSPCHSIIDIGVGIDKKRCACPIHRGDGRGRTFSVNFDLKKYQCFDVRCQSHGDVIDLWAALFRLSLRDAALDLVRTFDLEPVPATEKRNG